VHVQVGHLLLFFSFLIKKNFFLILNQFYSFIN
jgi:hypothetical protein